MHSIRIKQFAYTSAPTSECTPAFTTVRNFTYVAISRKIERQLVNDANYSA